MDKQYKLAPLEPTDEMINAMNQEMFRGGTYKRMYKAAIGAAPKQPSENESEIILNWLVRHMSASELQRIGIPCPPGCTIDDIKRSMKQWKPADMSTSVQPSDTEILDVIRRYADYRVMASKGRATQDEVTEAWLEVKSAMRAEREGS